MFKLQKKINETKNLVMKQFQSSKCEELFTSAAMYPGEWGNGNKQPPTGPEASSREESD